jgi:DNA-binding NarL/FixJ family response regulator
MTTIRLVLADDHLVVREGLRAMLEAEPDFEVVGQTGGGSEVASLVSSLHPDILVLDLMPGLGGLEVIREVSRRWPETRIVVLSMHANEASVRRAEGGIAHGADPLTPRQREVMQLVAEGFTSAEIAERLFISPRTVETHRANLMHKLGLRTPADVVRYAVRHGVVAEP